jgi:hypothetical protein
MHVRLWMWLQKMLTPLRCPLVMDQLTGSGTTRVPVQQYLDKKPLKDLKTNTQVEGINVIEEYTNSWVWQDTHFTSPSAHSSTPPQIY